VEEVMQALAPHPGSLQIDGTLGGGGHAVRILEATSPDGRLLGLDADAEAVERAARRLAPFGGRVVVRRANFGEIGSVARDSGFDPSDGIFLDLGLSSHQLADETRGFSFRAAGPLDMRFNATSGEPASELVANLDEAELAALFRRYGEEPFANRVARAVVAARRTAPIATAAQLAAIVEHAVPGRPSGRRRVHPATRVFQALRIAVNHELDALEAALAAGLQLLRPGGRLVVLTYHSLEDRIVKRFIAAERRGCVCPPELPVCVCGHAPTLRVVPGTPATPSPREISVNPRSRSARLRAAERLAA
jgi:16S rRNA (cytosine1402-N4)-methyltransferase